MSSTVTLRLHARPILWVLILTFAMLLALSLVGVFVESENPWLARALGKLHFDREGNPPTFFSVLMLLSSSLALVVIAVEQAHTRWRWHWAGLAAGFLIIAYDEFAAHHELLIEPLRTRLGVGGYLYFAWVVPGIALVVVIALVYLPFLAHLPRDSRRRLVLAAAVYFAGALGLEMIGGNYFEAHGRDTTYQLITTVEESLEMIGAILWLYALMRYLTREGKTFVLRVELTAHRVRESNSAS